MKVTLTNEGVDAYLPDEFGQRIIVERRISKNGSSEYRIYSQDNTVRIYRPNSMRTIFMI